MVKAGIQGTLQELECRLLSIKPTLSPKRPHDKDLDPAWCSCKEGVLEGVIEFSG